MRPPPRARGLLRERDTGAAIDPSRQTLARYLWDEWLPSREPTTVSAGRGHRGKIGIQTWDSYRGDLERRVIPRLGGVVLQKLTPSDLNRLYDDLERSGGRAGAGLSPKTIANIYGVPPQGARRRGQARQVARNVADAIRWFGLMPPDLQRRQDQRDHPHGELGRTLAPTPTGLPRAGRRPQ